MWRAVNLQPVFSPPEPVGAEEFEKSMAAFVPPASPRIALAVSGGPDSMAMAWLAKGWAEKKNFALKAFIVDHGLRMASAAEAKETLNRLSRLGIDAEILRWDHTPIVSKIHATARKARYRLLAEACKKSGISDLLLAHNREDQAETILMRFAKGSGVGGLAGIRSEGSFDDIRILRPLLDFSKERLRATCRSARVSFITDPSNSAEKYARGRLRIIMPLLADEGFTIDRLIDLGSRASEASAALDHYTSLLLRVGGRLDDFGVVKFDLEQLRSSPRAVAARAVAHSLQVVHAEEYPPEQASLDRLLDLLLADDEMQPRTLQGCLIHKTSDHAVFMREFSAIAETGTLSPGETVIWDGRWEISLSPQALPGRYSVSPLGNPPHDLLDNLAPGLRHRLPQGRARASLPSLRDSSNLLIIPAFGTEAAAATAHARLLSRWPG